MYNFDYQFCLFPSNQFEQCAIVHRRSHVFVTEALATTAEQYDAAALFFEGMYVVSDECYVENTSDM